MALRVYAVTEDGKINITELFINRCRKKDNIYRIKQGTSLYHKFNKAKKLKVKINGHIYKITQEDVDSNDIIFKNVKTIPLHTKSKIPIENNIIKIVTSIALKTCAEMIQYHIQKLGLDSTIIYKLEESCQTDQSLYLIIHHNQSTIWMPPRYIMWQIEQTEEFNASSPSTHSDSDLFIVLRTALLEHREQDLNHLRAVQHVSNSIVPKFNERYFQDLQNSICVFEMSRDNIRFYQEKISPTPIYYQPLPFAQLSNYNTPDKYLYDVVFFGTPNPRRMVILESLRKKLPSEIKTNWLYKIYNTERDEILQQAKIVLNLHYYENPVLETDRFNIAINNNCHILSEDVEGDIENKELYQEFVTFFDPINVDDSDKLGEGIDKLVKIITDGIPILSHPRMLEQISSYHIHHNLSLIDYLSVKISDQKQIHRNKCSKYLPIIRSLPIKEFGRDSTKETILLEFRVLPHIEFLIRNTILKLSNQWNHTVVCGKNNTQFIKSVCHNISPSINIITLDIENILPSDYSRLLTTKHFWHNFTGEKLLIYQEDTILFNGNIENFLDYDYIGASWNPAQNDNLYGVGNGGFSLRTKSKLILCLETIQPSELDINSSTIEYMKNTKSTFLPEDVYFSKTMIDFKLGKVAKRDIADKFSQETQKCSKPMGGHQFWLAQNELATQPYINTFKLGTNYYQFVTHRRGWKYVIRELQKTNLINENGNVILVDIMCKYFLWDKKNKITRDWVGILHLVQDVPSHIHDNINIDILLSNKNFKSSLPYCKGIVTLSKYVKEYIDDRINIPIYYIKHPTYLNCKKFSMSVFEQNNDYKVILLGQQLRKISTIYQIKTKYSKLWLPGCKKKKAINLVKNEMKNPNLKDVKILQVTDLEYDDIIINNIVIIDLFAASANNSILEMIASHTPFFINKLESVLEYLGEEYPMYFNYYQEVEDIINDKELLMTKFKLAHSYLKNLSKNDISINSFNKKLFEIIN